MKKNMIANSEKINFVIAGDNLIDSRELKSIISNIEKSFSTPNRNSKILINTVSEGSIDIAFFVDTITNIFGGSNIDDFFNRLQQIGNFIIESGNNNWIISGGTTSVFQLLVKKIFQWKNGKNSTSTKVKEEIFFTKEEVELLVDYFENNPENHVVVTKEFLRGLSAINKKIIRENSSVTIKSHNHDYTIDITSAKLMQAIIDTKDITDDIELEERVASIKIKNLDLLGNEKWSAYDTEKGSKKAIKLIISDDFRQLVKERKISFLADDIIQAIITEKENSKGTLFYEMKKYIGKVDIHV